MRKEIIGDCTLYLGDCRDILPQLEKVDACLTDPPYGIGHLMKGGKGTGHWNALSHGNEWDAKAPDMDLALAAAEQHIIWGGNYFPLPPRRCWLVWDKQNAVPTMGQCEIAWTTIEKPIQRIALPVGRNNHGHPTEKPLALMQWCLGFLPDAQTIVDPFMGSGTTGVACVKMGRSFIGIEKEERYFQIACKRIKEAYAQADMFVSQAAKKPEQVALEL